MKEREDRKEIDKEMLKEQADMWQREKEMYDKREKDHHDNLKKELH